jgi:hypothetical protein
MKIETIVARTNALMGHGNYLYENMATYLDECIDAINVELNVNLPLISAVYANEFDLLDTESSDDFIDNAVTNDYGRLDDAYIRNYICYETAYRIMRDEDEDQETYYLKFTHAQSWFKKIIANFANFKVDDTEAISINGDADELDDNATDDTALGFYNPLFDSES